MFFVEARYHRSPERAAGQILELFSPAERAVRLVHGGAWARRWLRLGRRGGLWARDPEKAARRAMFRLASKAMPRSIREVLRALRGVRSLDLRQR